MRVIESCSLALLLSIGLSVGAAQAEPTYKFTVHNKTDSTIVKLITTLDGSKWGAFDIGAGIPAQSSSVIAWSEETNDSNCELPIKATYADGSESVESQHDFCKDGLEINFVE